MALMPITNYLLNCLSGPTLEVVQAFQISDENYSKALEQLKNRYDNEVLIFLDYNSNLFNLPTMPKADTTMFPKLIDSASAIRGSLLSLGSAENVMNSIMIHYDEKQLYEALPDWNSCCKILTHRCNFCRSAATIPWILDGVS